MEQLQNRPIVFTSTHENTNASIGGYAEYWIDLIPLETKYTIASLFESIVLCYGLSILLAPNWHRHQLRYKTGWNETEFKIPTHFFDWCTQRSALALVTHAQFWLLYETLGLQPHTVYALSSLPLGTLSFYSLFNGIPKECNISNRADMQILIMSVTTLSLLFINSSLLLLVEKICNLLTFMAGLQLYLAPTFVSWIYNIPLHFPESKVASHLMNCYGYCLLVMSTLGSALIWQDESNPEYARETTIFALATSLLLGVVGYILMIDDARMIISNMTYIYCCSVIVLAVGTILMIL